MTCTHPTIVRRVRSVFGAAALAVLLHAAGPVTPVPARRADGGAAPAGGYAAVLWSALDGCLGPDAAGPAAVCLKTKALTALDRALAKPAVAVTDGVSLRARAAGSPRSDPPTAGQSDRAALEAAKDPDHKSAILDGMLADRMDEFVSTRTIVLDGTDVQEGRGKKKKQKIIQKALVMASMIAFAVLGPMAVSFIGLLAGKALLISKVALLTTGLMSIKKLLQPSKSSHSSSVSNDRNSDIHSHYMAYSGQTY